MNKFFDKILDNESLCKYLIGCGIGINLVFIVVIASKIIHAIAGL